MTRHWRLSPLARHVTVQVKGGDLEEFINLCVGRGIRLWGAERPASHMLIVRMDARDFPRLRGLGPKFRWQARIIERHGGGFVLSSLLRRRSFLVGGMLAAIAWYVLSSYIWFVRVEGVERVAQETVLAIAREAGVAPGILSRTIDADQVQRALLLGVEDLVWAGIELRGTQAVIRVAERRVPDTASQGPGHIVAATDGVIDRISVLAGVAVVQVGETVRAGQLLISGQLPPGSEEFNAKTARGELPYIRAAGSVHALVWHQASAEAVVGAQGVEHATRQAVEVAMALAAEWLDQEQAEAVGEPVTEVEEDPETGIVRANVLVQAVRQVGRFEPVAW